MTVIDAFKFPLSKNSGSLFFKDGSSPSKAENKLGAIVYAALLGIPFCWVDIEVAKRTIGKPCSDSFITILKKRPFHNVPLSVLYSGHYAATKIAGEFVKSSSDQSVSAKLYEGLAMVMVNNPGAQVLNRAVIKSLYQTSSPLPLLSSGTALLLGRDLTLWCGNTIAKDLTGNERWLARAGIFLLTTAFHLAANLALSKQPIDQLFRVVKKSDIIPLLAFRGCRVGLAEIVVNGPENLFK